MVGRINVACSKTIVKSKTFSGIANLIRLLPTILFQFLNPPSSQTTGRATIPSTKYLSSVLITLRGISCCVSCFIDRYQGETPYGFTMVNGMWPSTEGSSADLSSYKLRFGDFMHMVLMLFVFSALTLLDTCTVKCFYPSFALTGKTLIMVLPMVIGVVAGAVFMVFPNNHHGIGYSLS